MAGKITEMAAATTLAGTELVEVVQSGTNKKATITQILAAAQPLDATLTALAALDSSTGFVKQTAADTFSKVTPAVTDLAALTVSRALATDGSGVITTTSVTAIELGYVSGVTGALQTQLDAKAPLASPTFTGTVTVPTPFTIGAVSMTATGTELNYVAGVTSAIQTQLNAKQASLGFTPEDSANKNASGGYAGLTAGKIAASQMQEVLAVTDLTTYESVSGTGTAAVAATFTSLTTNDVLTWNGSDWINQAASAGGYAKLTASGTNGGTMTLYDDTAVTGASQLNIRAGAADAGGNPYLFQILDSGNNVAAAWRVYEAGTAVQLVTRNSYSLTLTDGANHWGQGLDWGGIRLASDYGILWNSGTNIQSLSPDLGLAKASAGALKVTDGSSGYGGLQALAVSANTANGANLAIRTISESITLNTGGTTTDSSANLLPANSFILGVTARITTGIGTATDWKLGDGTTAGRFTAANSTLTAGTTDTGLLHLQGSVSTDAAGPIQVAAAKLRITTTGTPSAGVIRVTVTYIDFTAPTS